MYSPEDKLRYIRERADEIIPITSQKDLVRAVVEADNGVSRFPQDTVEQVIEEAETNVFFFENEDAKSGAKRVLITMDTPGSYVGLLPIIRALTHDERCRSVEVLASGSAAKLFVESGIGFTRVRDSGKPVLYDALKLTEGNPIDVVFASVSTKNGPETAALLGGKSNFGATRLFVVVDGWGSNRAIISNAILTKQIDGIFCNDELARQILVKQAPAIPSEKIYATGTGQLESLELDRAEEFRRFGRQKLSLDDETTAFLYLGDISTDYKVIMPDKADPDISEKTFRKLLAAFEEVAKRNPEKKFALLVRPHPRDSRQRELFQMAERAVLSSNAIVKLATNDVCSFNEAAYASDAVASIMSTENFRAPLRGQQVIFLGFAGDGMGADGLEAVYGRDILSILRETTGVKIISSTQELEAALETIKHENDFTSYDSHKAKDSVDSILQIAFS